jgi:hypothetical protein
MAIILIKFDESPNEFREDEALTLEIGSGFEPIRGPR